METAEALAGGLEVRPVGDGWRMAASGGCVVALRGTLHEPHGGDAAEVLRFYLDGGTPVLESLRGEFALVVSDDRDGAAFAMRDAIGISPLFSTEVDGRLLVSTSVDKLLAEPGVSSALNAVAIADALCHRWPDPTETYFEQIRRVPPGHLLRLRDGAVEIRRWWHPAPPDRPIEWVGRDELERFAELFEQAVARSVGGDPSGIYLSGGLDSVSVAGVAADLARRAGEPDPLALSLIFPASANEEAVQRGVAAGLGIEQIVVPFHETLGGRGLLEAALADAGAWPAPLANVWYPAYAHLAGEAVARGRRVILSGGGGDEWLTVSPLLAADLLRRGDILGAFRFWQSISRSFRLSRLQTLRSTFWTFGAKPLLAAAAAAHAPHTLARYRQRQARLRMPEWLAADPELRAELLDRAARVERGSGARGFYLREVQLSLDHALISLEMEELHAARGRTGMPVRMPFWEADLVDFLYRIRPELLNEGGRTKGLVRRVLDERFPGLDFGRHKKVLAVDFFAQTILREGPRVWQDLGGAAALTEAGIVEPAHVESFAREVFGGSRMREVARLWNLMSFEAWCRQRL